MTMLMTMAMTVTVMPVGIKQFKLENHRPDRPNRPSSSKFLLDFRCWTNSHL